MIAGLPYDAEVEYLQADGNAYLSIGLPILSGESIEFVMDNSDAVGIYGVFSDIDKSSWNDGRTFVSNGWSSSSNRIVYAASAVGAIGYFTGTMRVTIPGGDNVRASVTINGNTYSDQAGGNRYDIEGFRIFNSVVFGGGATISQAGFRVYSFKTDSIDLIPVRVGTEGAMYDRVSRKLFRNAGTGAFTIGPDVATPVMGLHFMPKPVLSARNYVQDGLIAMWDGIENAGWGVHDPNATTWKDLVSGTQSGTLQSTEEITEKSVITTSRDLILIDDVESIANGIDTLTIQRVAGELAQSAYNNAAGGVSFCAARFGWCMYFRHVSATSENGYGYGPMGYSFAPYFGSFGKGFYSPSSTYGLNSRTMIVGANNNPVSGYEGTYQLPAYGTGLLWGGASTDVSAKIFASTSGRVMNSCIRIYSRALTAAELAANYAVDKERFNLP